MMSLIGGVAPRKVKADVSIEAKLKGDASLEVVIGTAETQPNSTETGMAAAIKKGDKSMNSIDTTKNGVGEKSSLPGE